MFLRALFRPQSQRSLKSPPSQQIPKAQLLKREGRGWWNAATAAVLSAPGQVLWREAAPTTVSHAERAQPPALWVEVGGGSVS